MARLFTSDWDELPFDERLHELERTLYVNQPEAHEEHPAGDVAGHLSSLPWWLEPTTTVEIFLSGGWR